MSILPRIKFCAGLTDDAGKSGKFFFNGFSVFNEVQKRYPKFYVNLYSDTLRSEHIPFNLFVPFRHDLTSKYYSISKDCGLYEESSMDILLTDIYRQVWRNQLLAESIRLVHNSKIKHSSSLTFYPEGNEHFAKTSEKYIGMLLDMDNKFIPVTYEEFLSACYKHCPNNDFKTWIDYLTKRYIVQND